MRTVFDPQMGFGQVDIADIKLDPKSRDDIPQLLRGLQHLHGDPELRERVFAILEGLLPERAGAEGKASPKTGHPGMAQWRILVLGVLRLGLNADYDRIQELANQHATIRLMLGHGDWADDAFYERRLPGAGAGLGVLEAERAKIEASDVGVDGADGVAFRDILVNARRQQHPLPAVLSRLVGSRLHLLFLLNGIMPAIMPKSQRGREGSFTVSHPTVWLSSSGM